MKPLITSLKILTVFSFILFFQGCQDDDVELPTIEAGFTHTINNDIGKVTFLNTSENADSYMWDFGDGTTSTEINPIKIYGTGTYTVKLTAKNAAGATDVYEDVITINIPLPVTIPFNFDGANVVYDATVFNGVSFAIVDNPGPGGTNATASKVGAITNSGAAWEGLFFNLGTAVDLSTDMTIKMDFWSDKAVDVLMKLENGTGPNVETTASHTGSSEWEELIFTFNTTDSFSTITIFVDGPGTTAGTFYFDNVRQTATVDLTPPVITLVGADPLNLNVGDTYTDPGATATDNTDGDITANIVVGGDTVDTNTAGTYTVTYNVSDAAGNAAAEVTRTVVVTAAPVGPQVAAPTPSQAAADVISVYSDAYTDIAGTDFNPNWGQATVVTNETVAGDNVMKYAGLNYQGIQLGSSQDVSGMDFLHIDYWTENSTALNVFLISTGPVETAKALTVPTTGWASVDIPLGDFSPVDLTDVIQLKFDGNGDIWLDNIYFYKNTTPACTDTNLEVPIDFDCATIDYATKIVGNVGFTVIDNPEMNGIHNVATKVGQINNAGANWENAFFNLDVPLDFNNGTVMKMKLFSNQALPIKLKVEDGTSGPIEADANHGGTGWEELTFNFTSTDSYNDMVIFVDGPGTAAGTFYVDDIEQISGGGGGGGGCTGTPVAATTLPVTFETCETFLSTFTADGSITAELAANPDMSGINTSANVLKVVKAAGTNRWAGVQNPFPNNFDMTKTFKFKIRSSKAGVVMRFEVNSDPQPPASGNPGPQFHTMGPANTWEEVSIVFTGIPPSNTGLNQIVIKPDNPSGTDGETTTTEETYYIDDFRVE